MHERKSEYRGPHTAFEGFYRVRLTRGGPWVGAEIRITDDGAQAYVDGALSLEKMGGWGLMAVDVIAIWGEEIPEAEHRFLLAQAEHARVHQPHHPSANPRKSIDLRLLPPVYVPTRRLSR
jgi:hypothetical protein